jgi:hypothetical protein
MIDLRNTNAAKMTGDKRTSINLPSPVDKWAIQDSEKADGQFTSFGPDYINKAILRTSESVLDLDR